MKTEAENKREGIYRILSYNMSDSDRDKLLNLIDDFTEQEYDRGYKSCLKKYKVAIYNQRIKNANNELPGW